MSCCALCTMPLNEGGKTVGNPEGEGMVHLQCQNEHDQAHGVCRDSCETCGEYLVNCQCPTGFPCSVCGGMLTNADRKRPGAGSGSTDGWLVHGRCIEALARGVKPRPAGPTKTLDEAFAELAGNLDEQGTEGCPPDNAKCFGCGISLQMMGPHDGNVASGTVTGDGLLWHSNCYSNAVHSGRIVGLLREAGKLALKQCQRCGDVLTPTNTPKDRSGIHPEVISCTLCAPYLVGAPPPASARARARAIEDELRELARREQENEKRRRELIAEKAEADKRARAEEHEENARGWVSALSLCLEHGKAALEAGSYLPPGRREGMGTSEYRFRLFSGEEVSVIVKHAPGARPPKVCLP